MRYLAVGDIHGCYTALKTLAEYVPFLPEDKVITLGDYVDRGPDTRAVIEWLIDYQKRNQLFALRGNHEIMMLRARDEPDALAGWLASGGQATLASYSRSGRNGQLIDIPEEHWRFLETTARYFAGPHHFFVHANAHYDMDLDEQPDYMLFWENFENSSQHKSGKLMICGHTSLKSGLPRSIGHAICIDTWACGQGWLTCLDVRSGKYWQANQRGETRSAYLEHEDA